MPYDLAFAWRQLRKNPAFSSVVLLTLALCIGANTAMFSMVYALLLKPLPFPQPTRIVEIYNAFTKDGFDKMPSNIVQYSDYAKNAGSYRSVGLWGYSMDMIGEEGSAERVSGIRCTPDMFDVLGVKPLIGQFFTQRNTNPGEDKVVVLSESYWESHYHTDPAVIGQTLRMDAQAYRIIGVAPGSVQAFDARVHFIRPISWKPADVNPMMRFSLNTPLFARLKDGVSASQALSEAQAIEKRFYDSAPPPFKEFLDRAGHRIQVGLVQAERVKPIRSSMYLLQGGVVFVLIIGCVNIANLMLARANSRQGELAVRAALGAGSLAIARQLLIECLFLALCGAALGVGLAEALVRVMNVYSDRMLPDMLPFAVDGRALAYAAGLSVAVALVIGLFPIVHTLRSNLAAVLSRGSRSVSGHKGVRRLSSVLAYDISQRTREIGVRGAIGASREQIIRMILAQGLVKTVVGIAAGLVGAVFLSRYMTGLLFELKPSDPWAYAAVSVVLAATALLASYLPARAASAIEPTEALRSE
jgi:predicted permease